MNHNLDMESQSQKKTYGGANAGFGDVYGVLMLSKEMIDLDKDPPPFELRFQVPDFKLVLKVSRVLFLWVVIFSFALWTFSLQEVFDCG